jgi:hypothetical protein
MRGEQRLQARLRASGRRRVFSAICPAPRHPVGVMHMGRTRSASAEATMPSYRSGKMVKYGWIAGEWEGTRMGGRGKAHPEKGQRVTSLT